MAASRRLTTRIALHRSLRVFARSRGCNFKKNPHCKVGLIVDGISIRPNIPFIICRVVMDVPGLAVYRHGIVFVKLPNVYQFVESNNTAFSDSGKGVH